LTLLFVLTVFFWSVFSQTSSWRLSSLIQIWIS